MWKPPARIRHELPEPYWPGREEAESSLLFSPITLGSVRLEERTWVPAMVPWRATEDGFVTEHILDWYERFAQGQPGAIVVEATGIRDVPSGPLLRIGDDRFIPGLEKLVRTVRRASKGRTRLFIQLIDFLAVRRRPEPEKFFRKYLQITHELRQKMGIHLSETAIRQQLQAMSKDALQEILSPRDYESLEYGYRERVTDVHLEHVRELPQVLPDLFADAASRAQKAGFDGVELHYAHAYTMASFLSATNTRDDGYGGEPEHRVRVPLEVYRRVREKVGPRFTVGCRYLSEDCIEGGSTVEDAIFFGRAFARAGMDFLSLSRGGKFDDARKPRIGRAVYPYTGPSGYECMPTVISDEFGPFGRNVDPVSRIRAAVRDAGSLTPIVVAGGICDFRQSEDLLQSGQADVVAAARQTLADPDWFRKMRLGAGGQVRRCIFTNYCEGLDQLHKQVTCQLWDREAMDEPGLKLAADSAKKKPRRLVAPAWDDEPQEDAPTHGWGAEGPQT